MHHSYDGPDTRPTLTTDGRLLRPGSRPGQEVSRVEMELRPTMHGELRKPVVVALKERGRPRYGFPDPFDHGPIQGGSQVVTLYLAEDEAARLGRMLLMAVGIETHEIPHPGRPIHQVLHDSDAAILTASEFATFAKCWLEELRDWQRGSAEAGRRAIVSPGNFEQAEPGRGE